MNEAHLIGADVLRPEQFRRLAEIRGKPGDAIDVEALLKTKGWRRGGDSNPR